jgi:hypothetical protein
MDRHYATPQAQPKCGGGHPLTVYDWRKRLRRQERLALPDSAGAAPAFAAVVVEDAPWRHAATCIEIVLGDIVIRAEPGVDEEHLSRIIRIARSAQ